MIDLKRIKGIVGQAEYEEACRQMPQEAANLMRWRSGCVNSPVPYKISDLIWAEEKTVRSKLDAIFAIYEELPAYALLAGIAEHWKELGASERNSVWARFRGYLYSDEESVSRPVEYTLWCDYFENPKRVAEAWLQMLTPPRSLKQVEKLLFVSGPVPYWLKKTLYEEIIQEDNYHEAIFTSLLGSRFDILGDIDKADAGAILHRLTLEPSPPQFEMLRAALEK
ncbi:hypothetical protein [Azotosporobacter soli]|uniref:hypothetical protein n=1 Tax=Azotosporobacter soli TaxID=3055040 RepID=UPI0031FE57D0